MLKQLAEVIMSDLCDWFITNRLTLSLEKSNFNIFHSPKKNMPVLCNQLKISNINVDQVSCVKYLGVEFGDNLNWNAHVKSVCNVLVKYAGSFKIIKGHLPKTSKRQLYFAYIYTKILYGLEVYCYTSRGNINKIQVLQNKCLKTLYQKDWFTHTNDLHKDLNVLKVEDIYKHSMVQLVYKGMIFCLMHISLSLSPSLSLLLLMSLML